MTHEFVGVIVERFITRASAHDVVEKILEPFRETYDPDDGDDGELTGWWDFWSIGGRWTGVWLKDYEPDKDPRNRGDRPCFICNGTGLRPDTGSMTREEYIAWCGGCNGCHGSGWYPPHPSDYFPIDEDVLPVARLLDDDTLRVPRRLVLPDSGVICRDDWTGADRSYNPSPEWAAHVRAELAPYREAAIVAVDVHV